MGLPNSRLKGAFVILATALLPLLFFTSVSTGSVSISFDKVVSALLGNSEGVERTIVWSYRVPRTIASLVAGAALAINGVVLQALTRNPLASPFTLGLNSAASFGAALAIILGKKLISTGDPFALTAAASTNAFAFSILAMVLVTGLAGLRGMTPESLVLGGIAVAYLFSAATSCLQYLAGETQLRIFVLWSMGDLMRVDWLGVYLLFVALVASTALSIKMAWDLNALSLGDETAASLGTNPKRTRLVGTLATALSTALVASQIGPVGFVCLMSPHIARYLVGADNRYVIPMAAIIGTSLLTIADVGARTLMRPAEIPVGVITAMFGAPFFLGLFVRARRRIWQ
jgi:iron complex transport system permease protein